MAALCSENRDTIERMTHRSSAQDPTCGNRSLIGSPLRPRGRLMAILEMGKAERFHLRSIIRAEDLARAFVSKAESSGWSV